MQYRAVCAMKAGAGKGWKSEVGTKRIPPAEFSFPFRFRYLLGGLLGGRPKDICHCEGGNQKGPEFAGIVLLQQGLREENGEKINSRSLCDHERRNNTKYYYD